MLGRLLVGQLLLRALGRRRLGEGRRLVVGGSRPAVVADDHRLAIGLGGGRPAVVAAPQAPVVEPGLSAAAVPYNETELPVADPDPLSSQPPAADAVPYDELELPPADPPSSQPPPAAAVQYDEPAPPVAEPPTVEPGLS